MDTAKEAGTPSTAGNSNFSSVYDRLTDDRNSIEGLLDLIGFAYRDGHLGPRNYY